MRSSIHPVGAGSAPVVGFAPARRTLARQRPHDPALRATYAAAVACTMGYAYAEAAGLPPPASFPHTVPEISSETLLAARAIAALAADLTPEHASYEMGLSYIELLPPAIRARFGIFYTPPAIADRLLDLIEQAGADWSRARILEPSCGSGALLAPAARRLARAGVPPAEFASRLTAWEIDAPAAWLSRIPIDAIAGGGAAHRVAVHDTLRHEGGGPFDVIVGNPPFGRVSLDPAMRARYADVLHGQANLYALFMQAALERLAPGGIVAYVLPTGFLGGSEFRALRRRLAETARPAAIEFLHGRHAVFPDVIQSACLAVFRRSPGRTTFPVSRFEPAGPIPVAEARLPRAPDRPWIIPRHREHAAVADRLHTLEHRLADWGWSASTGPLVWNRARDLLTDDAGPGTLPVLWAEAIRPDDLDLARGRRHGRRIRIAPDHPMVQATGCVVVQRTTSDEMDRRLIAAVCEPGNGVVIENHVTVLRPLGDCPAVPADILSRFLNSAFANEAWRCLSGTTAVSAYELMSLPLPSPDEALTLVEGVSSQRNEEGTPCPNIRP